VTEFDVRGAKLYPSPAMNLNSGEGVAYASLTSADRVRCEAAIELFPSNYRFGSDSDPP